jgi:hypothetical protein
MAEVYLSNKITDHTAIIKAHSWSICVEDSSNPHLTIIKLIETLLIYISSPSTKHYCIFINNVKVKETNKPQCQLLYGSP